MYLSRLEMVGFKSFAQKIDLSFNDGVTAIVGPNGCGKTNIVDAIRWVLGEQKTSMLRADSMDQVIFNGSKARKPLGMAEVSLTIENNKHILPTEYAQVVITRRLFRSGESQYLLNKTQCRLRDIVDLFMDTGMGADAYSVIELKMIETILSDKADERRHLFEEAAGVTKYKVRRKEAARKLEAAQRDIARVQDIVREVEKTVGSLARQAQKAKRHQELTTELRAIDHLLFAFDYAEEWAALTQLQLHIADVRARKETAERDLAQREEAVSASETAHTAAETELRQAQELENGVRSALGEERQRLSVLEERIVASQRALERLQREHNESAEQRVSTEEELQSVMERRSAAQLEAQQAVEATDQRRERVAAEQQHVVEARSAVDQKREALSRERQALSERRSESDRLRVQMQGLQRRLRDVQAQQQQLEERRCTVADHIERESADVPALDVALQAAEAALHQAEAQQNALRNEQESLQARMDELREHTAHTSASLEFLVGLVDTTESSKFLMNTSEWTPSGEKLTLAEVLNTADDLRIAIEAALGPASRYFVVANRAEANAAIAALSKNNVGKATFLCRDAIPELPEPPSIPQGDGIVGWASELVDTDPTLRGAVRGILGRTVVVDSIDAAWAAVQQSSIDAAVTRTGEVVHRSGAVRGGSVSKTEGVRVGRRERIDQLRNDVERLREHMATTDVRLSDVKGALAEIDLRQLGETVRRTAVARNERLQRLDALKGRLEDVVGQLQVLQSEQSTLVEEEGSIQHLIEAAEGGVADQQSHVASHESELQTSEQHLQAADQRLSEARALLRDAELVLVRLDGEVQTLQADEQRLRSQSTSIDQRRDQRAREEEDVRTRQAELEAERAAASTAVDSTQRDLTQATARREEAERVVRECSTATHQAIEDVRLQRKTVDAVHTELHEVDLKLNASTMRIENLRARAVEELELVLPESLSEQPELPASDRPREELREEAQELRRKLTSMGNVNFLALEEHERENERFEFLTRQLADLVESERTLNETIAEINRTAREKFTATFEAIRTNFKELFTVLFSQDDEADLQMIEEGDQDPLESKIEIIAKPRGKRPHSIEMLSGGEKTLTAIALLFAIYLVKPSPFCILDEVDAPLDDANIDRYLKIIRKFSENTQFLMITHNKKTMEAADTLYGVTMEEPAVSKVVSVQLSKG